MDWKKFLLLLLIALLVALAASLGYLYGTSSEEENTPEPPANEEAEGEGSEEEASSINIADWKCHTIGGGPNVSYIKYPADWFYVAVTGDLPGSSYEMFTNDDAIQIADHPLQAGQALAVVNLGPNNSYGQPLSDVIASQKELDQSQHPGATFEEKTIGDMEILITSYQEESVKVRQYYLVKEKAAGFITCRYLDDTLIATFDAMIETVELNQIGIYE